MSDGSRPNRPKLDNEELSIRLEEVQVQTRAALARMIALRAFIDEKTKNRVFLSGNDVQEVRHFLEIIHDHARLVLTTIGEP